jgi:hypothetical protein
MMTEFSGNTSDSRLTDKDHRIHQKPKTTYVPTFEQSLNAQGREAQPKDAYNEVEEDNNLLISSKKYKSPVKFSANATKPDHPPKLSKLSKIQSVNLLTPAAQKK